MQKSNILFSIMEIIACFIISLGLIYGILSKQTNGYISDTGLCMICMLICSLFYDIFFSFRRHVKTAAHFRGIHSTNLCYVLLVPCAFMFSQMDTFFDTHYHLDINHLALAVAVIPAVNQILLIVWHSSKHYVDSISENQGLLSLSTLPWCICAVFFFIDSCKWQGQTFSIILYVSVTCVCSVLQWTLAKKAHESFSLSEITIITQGCVIFAYQGIIPLFTTLFNYIKFRDNHIIESFLTNKVADIDVFTEVAAISALLVLITMSLLEPFQNVMGFYAMTLTVMTLFSLPILYLMLKQNFVTWMFEYIMFSTSRRQLFVFWAVICVVSSITVIITVLLSQKNDAAKSVNRNEETVENSDWSSDPHIKISMNKLKQRNKVGGIKNKKPSPIPKSKHSNNNSGINTTTRKVFHVIAVATFLPGIYFSPSMTTCAATCALIVFSFLECMRVLRLWPVGEVLNEYLNTFRDKQDQGPLILTPIYLLVGFTVPFWLHYSGTSDLTLYSGVIALGVGDTMSSVIGSRYGSHKWIGTNKTVEGTSAFIFGSLMFVTILNYVHLCSVHNWVNVILAVVLTSLLEAFTLQIDNLVLPLYLYCFLV